MLCEIRKTLLFFSALEELHVSSVVSQAVHQLNHQTSLCWSIRHLLIKSSSADQFVICWSIHHLLINSSSADQFIICWSILHLLMNFSSADQFIICWSIRHLLISKSTPDQSYSGDHFKSWSKKIEEESQII